MHSSPVHSPIVRLGLSAALLAAACATASAQLSAASAAKIDQAAQKVLAETGVPSASIGVVENGKIIYAKAFGQARLQPAVPATAAIAYPVGSISKQFTATAILLLAQDGKLTLDDPVAKYFPQLTRANEVTIRNILSHTSGYQDYAPQDYTIPRWLKPEDPLKIVEEFAGKPLDFDPGTQWQYSNTNFELAALIVQKVSGMPFAQFLRTRVLEPAHLESVLNLNTDQNQLQVTGYMRNALAPLRPAALEAPGWYFGDGDLAMPVSTLLTWDLTFINQSLLTPASYHQMVTPYILKNGTDTHYGLGIFVPTIHGQLEIEHSGEVGGFVAENIVVPAQGIAISVLTNQEASGAASQIGQALLPIALSDSQAASPSDATANAFAPKLQTILTGLLHGKMDRSLFTPDTNAYFDANALHDFQSSLGPLGSVKGVTLEHSALRGGMTFGSYKAAFSGGTSLQITVYLEPDGKIEQLLVEGKE